jgi:hypothetical protein
LLSVLPLEDCPGYSLDALVQPFLVLTLEGLLGIRDFSLRPYVTPRASACFVATLLALAASISSSPAFVPSAMTSLIFCPHISITLFKVSIVHNDLFFMI